MSEGQHFLEYDASFFPCSAISANEQNLTIPVIMTHPVDVEVPVMGRATFSVVAVGDSSLQWFQIPNTPLMNSEPLVVHAQTMSLTISSVTHTMDGDMYYVRVNDSGGTAVSNTASLNVGEHQFIRSRWFVKSDCQIAGIILYCITLPYS